MQERGVARLWEVARFDFLLPIGTRSSQMNAAAANDVALFTVDYLYR